MFVFLGAFSYLCKAMNKKTDIERMVMEAHYLDALETESKASSPLSEMEGEDYINQIHELRNLVASLKSTLKTMAISLESLNKAMIAKDNVIAELTATIKRLEEEIRTLRDRCDYNGKNTFGRKSLMRKKNPTEDTNRMERKDDYDGTDLSCSSDTDKVNDAKPLDRTKVKSEHLDRNGGPRGPYTPMDAARVITLESGMSGIPPEAKIIGSKIIEEYTKESYVVCTRFKVIVYEDTEGHRHEYYEPRNVGDTRRPHVNTVPGTHATPEFLSDLIVDSVQVGLPNQRMGIRMLIDRFTSCDNTRRNWLSKSVKLLSGLLPVFKAKLLKAKSVLNIDETWCRVRIKFHGDGTRLGRYFHKYIWVIVNKIEGVVYYLYDNEENDSRGHRPIHGFLGSFKGTIQSDGYNVYKQLAFENPMIDHVLCWAHVRAKFKYAEEISHDPDASFFLDRIGLLYLTEAECLMGGLTPDERRRKRRSRSVTKLLSAMYRKAKAMLKDGQAHYGEYMRKALNYMVNGWDDLQKYRTDGRYTIDNMLAERAVRPFVVKRNSAMFFSSEQGVMDAMTLYTIVETVKMYTTDVKGYIERALRWVMAGNEDCEQIAPWILYRK